MQYRDAILAMFLSSYACLIGGFQLSYDVVKNRRPALVRLSNNFDDTAGGSKEFCSLHPGIGIATIKLGNPEMVCMVSYRCCCR